MNHILAIDQGTTGSTALLLDENLNLITKHTVDFPQHFPKAGWVEHNTEEIWKSVVAAIQKIITPEIKIAAIGITNQRETVVPINRKTGEPLSNAIVWQCRRSEKICQRIKSSEDLYKKKTGLVLDPYFSGTKITWMQENGINTEDVIYLTMDAFILYKLTGNFATEASNASRTLCYDIHKGEYTAELCEPLGIDPNNLAPVKDSRFEFGRTKNLGFLDDGIVVSGILGDQQAALAGQGCFKRGMAKCTYGTGAFLLANSGDKPQFSNKGLLSTVAWSLDGKLTYALEGSAFIAGATMQFLRDQFEFFKDVTQTQKLAEDVTAAPEIYFVPALSGLGAPYWNPNARGAFFGLTRGTRKEEMVRAGLEAIAFQVCDLVAAMEDNVEIKTLSVDGGACANDLLMQIQANFLGKTVLRPKNLETTAYGAAMFAAAHIGLCDLDTFSVGLDKKFLDQEGDMRQHLHGWSQAVKAVEIFSR